MTIEEKNLLEWMESTIAVIKQADASAYRAEEVEGIEDARTYEMKGWKYLTGLCAMMISKQAKKFDVPIELYELRMTYRPIALSALSRGIEIF